MGKRIGSLVLSLVMLISLWPCEASAEELQTGAGTVPSSEYEVARGLCSSSVAWLLTSKDETSKAAPYTLYFAPLIGTDGKHVDGSEKLTVKEDANGIVSAGGDTWEKTWNTGVETIIVAEGITQIGGTGYGAGIFTNTTNWVNVKDLYLPEGLQSLNYQAFSGCSKLKTVYLPYMPESTPDGAFRPSDMLYWTEAYDVAQKDGQKGKFMSVNGVLYSGDGRTLLRFPARKSTDSTYTVPDSVIPGVNVEKIGDYAFALGNNGSKLETGISRFSTIVFPSTIREVGREILYADKKVSTITFLSSDEADADLTLMPNTFNLDDNHSLTLTLPSHMKKMEYISIHGNTWYEYTIRLDMPIEQLRNMENISKFCSSALVDRPLTIYTLEEGPANYSRCQVICYRPSKPSQFPSDDYGLWAAHPFSLELVGTSFVPPEITEKDKDMLKYKPERGVFRGWTVWTGTSSGGLGTVSNYAPGEAISVPSSGYNLVAYPRWFETEIKVSFNINGHGGTKNPAGFSVEAGEGLGGTYGELPEISDPDYRFLGWYTAAEGGEKIEPTTSTEGLTAAQTLYAHWEEKQACTVTLHPGADASVDPAALTLYAGDTYKGLPTPTRPNYSFTGWYTGAEENDGEQPVKDGDPLAADTDHALHAHWKVAKPITLTCKLPDGTEQTVAAQYEGVYPSLPAAEREGYRLLGWTVSGGDGTVVQAGDEITVGEDHTLEPVWEHLPTKVTYDPGIGILVQPEEAVKEVPVGGTYPDFPTIRMPDYDHAFLGWFTAPTGGTKVKRGDPLVTQEDHTLYAQWRDEIFGERLPEISFGFANRGSSLGYGSPYRIPYARYEMVFGDNAFARRYYESEPYWRGSCGGMVLTAAYFNLPGNDIKLEHYKPDAIDAGNQTGPYKTLDQLTPRSRHEDWNLSLVSLIEGMQIGQIHAFDLYEYRTAKTPQEIWEKTAAYERTGEHPVVAMLENADGVYHAALCYMVRDWTETEGRIYIYDPNYPKDKLNYITVTRASADAPYTGWKYEGYPRSLTGYIMTGEAPDWLDGLKDRAPTQSLDSRLCLICVQMPNIRIYDAKGNLVAVVNDGKAESKSADVKAVNTVTEAPEGTGENGTPNSYFLVPKGQYRVVNETPGAGALQVSMANVQSGVSVETASRSVILTADDAAGGGLSCAKIEDANAAYSIVLDGAELDADNNTVFQQSEISGTTGAKGASAALVDGALMTRNVDPSQAGTDISTRTFSEYATGEVDLNELEDPNDPAAIKAAQEAAAEKLEQFNNRWEELPENEKPKELPENIGSYQFDKGGSGGSGSGSSGGSGGSSGRGSGTSGGAESRPDIAKLSFQDCVPGAWYEEAVSWCVAHDLMQGVAAGRFAPGDPLSRAQAVQILYRRAGSPAVSAAGSFSDVAEGAWYYDAVTWAAAQGIVKGCGGGRFDPDAPVTREQLTVLLFRAAGTPAAESGLERFEDHASVSAWAEPALRWAVAKELIRGRTEKLLAPGDAVTRAEAAMVFMNMGDV